MIDLTQTPKRLKQSILMEAMQGKLTKQLPSDGNVNVLLKEINLKSKYLMKNGKLKSHKILPNLNKDKYPFKIPNNWAFKRIYDISEINTGFPFKKRMYTDTGARLFRITDFNEHGLVNTNLRYVKYNNKFKNFVLKSGDILMAMNGGTVGKTSPALKITRTSLLYQRIARFHAIGILDKFLDCYLKSPYVKNKINKHTNNANIPTISLTFLRHLYIPIPPLAEQKRIVQRLDQILPKIDGLNKEVVRLHSIRKAFPHRLKQSLLMEAMQGKLTKQLPSDGNADELLQKIQQKKQALIKAGKIRRHKKLPPISKDEIPFKVPRNWKWIRLQDICNYIQKGKSPKYSSTGIPILNQRCIQWSGIKFINHKSISLKIFKTFSHNRLLRLGDILWNTTGTGTLGRLSIVGKKLLRNHQKIVVNGDVMIIRVNDKVISKFIYDFLCSFTVQKYLKYLITGSTNQIHLNLSAVLPLLVPLPPLNEQKEIVKKLRNLFSILSIGAMNNE